MKIKTTDLVGRALDWAVAKCEGTLKKYVQPNEARGTTKWEVVPATLRYSTDWAQGGPIIEREKIELIPPKDEDDPDWLACWYQVRDIAEAGLQEGPTPLIAAMRCFVASKLGDEVDIPEELL